MIEKKSLKLILFALLFWRIKGIQKNSGENANKASRILDTQCTGNTVGTYPCDDIDLEAFIASSTFTESSSKRLSE